MGAIYKFGDLITFSAGTNITRLGTEVAEDCIYTLEDFDSDLCDLTAFNRVAEKYDFTNKRVVLNVGDVVISMTRNKAGIVSSSNSGKYLNSNFVKCEFDYERLYPWYFCYLLNEATTVSQQIKKVQQGTISCINRLTIPMIEAFKFELEDISKQKTVGNLYRNLLIRERLTLKQMEDMRKYTLEIIKKVDNN